MKTLKTMKTRMPFVGLAAIPLVAVGLGLLVCCAPTGSSARAAAATTAAATTATTPTAATVSHVTLKLSNLDCAACAVSIKSVLSEMNGVRRVTLNYDAGKADVDYDAARVQPQQMVAAIDRIGFKASL
ncbi:MAG: heavy-metal-associated domain-containing protein [Acidobacteriota bacterium]|nr:heavy-metal-associated domain-containing protein [Acidobacteriota bacterium]